jgi:glycosyltransferase involved in cell wall biosynthesis
LKAVIHADQPDLVHAHWSYEFALAAIYSNFPYLVTCHDSPVQVLKYMTNHYRFGRLLMALWVFRTAKKLTAVSPYLKDEIAKFTGTPIAVIPNPTPRESECSDLSEADIHSKMARPTIAMISNGWGKLKNTKPAMLAFNRLLAEHPQATLHIFGAGFEVNGPAHLWAEKNQVQENIVFHGPTQNAELLNFLREATLLLHPALQECCPLSLIEAMSCGLPVVGGESSGGVPWILDYGKAGALTDVSSPEKIASTLRQLLRDQKLYQSLRKNGLARVNQLFTKQSVLSAYEALYREIVIA